MITESERREQEMRAAALELSYSYSIAVGDVFMDALRNYIDDRIERRLRRECTDR